VFCDNSEGSGLVFINCSASQPTSTPTCSSLLPLDLIDFTGELVDGELILSWLTTNEVNFSHFELQVSKDSRTFNAEEVISIPLKASGNFNIYKASNIKIGREDIYARLKMIDLNGEYEYSEVLRFEGRVNKVNVYPNPLTSRNLNIDIKENSGAVINVYAADGTLIKKVVNGNDNQLSIELPEEIKGILLVEVIQGSDIQTFKVIK